MIAGGRGLLEWYVNRVAFYPVPGSAVDLAEWPVPVESVHFDTADGIRLHGYYLPADGADRVLLYLHGNAGNASHRLPVATQMAALGIAVFLPDYRGYGLSEGRPSERGIYADGRAALEYLYARGFEPERIVVFGRSLGGAVATRLMSEGRLAGLVLCSTFTSGADMARSIGLGLLAPLVADRFDNLGRIGGITAPKLFLHGARDRIVPLRLGRELFDAAGEPKRWVEMPAAGHNDVTTAGAEQFWPALAAFLRGDTTGG